MEEEDEQLPPPKVGVSLLVVRGDKILLSRRKGSHGAGQYGTPGGHLENGESFSACALRELEEECGPGLKVTDPRPLCVTNLRDYLPKHYVDMGMVAHWISGEPETMEPEKAENWGWHPIGWLPVPYFTAVESLVIAYGNGQWHF